MGVFQDVTLTWGGDDFTVPANQVMRLIAQVEDIISLQELSQSGGGKLSKISEAYMVALNHAGCKVMHEDVYAAMFGEDGADSIGAAVNGLLMMMLPPATYQPDTGKRKAPAKRTSRKKG
jgi:hypothetical protein